MVTFPIVDKKTCSHTVAFEIENAYVNPDVIARLLEGIDGVSRVRFPGGFGRRSQIAVEFRYMEIDYVVWEPYGETTKYWIGPKIPSLDSGCLDQIENVFKDYRPPLYRQLMVELMSLPLVRHLVGT